MKSMEAVEEILKEDPRTRKKEYNWLFFTQVLRKLGFKTFIEFDRRMPSPETLFREKREILNRRNKYAEDFIPEEGITYEKPTSIVKEESKNE